MIPITRVTLLEDRAYVVREGTVELAPILRIPGVSAALVDKTATGRLSAGRVLDVQVVRSTSTVPRPSLAAIQARLGEVDAERQLALGSAASARKLAEQLIEEVAREASRGQDPRAFTEPLDELENWELELATRLAELEDERARLSAELDELNKVPESQLQAELVITAEGTGTAELRVEYCVPGACWRPYHAASLEGELTFRCDACVWQNTGEDWTDVTLSFSTQRSSLGSSPPPLSVDRLELQKKVPETVIEVRDQEIRTTGATQALRLSSQVPGIDDGGEVLQLVGPSPATVPADGRPTRVALFQFSAAAPQERMLTAEVSPCVVVKSVQVNASRFPLLAGPVDLVRDGGLLGRTQVLFVAPGESFALSWGPDPLVRVHRQAEKDKEEKVDMLGTWLKTEHRVGLRLSNLGNEPKTVQVLERIPVSEARQVEVLQDVKGTSQEVAADEHGLVRWTVELGPRARRELKLAYAVKRRKEAVL